MGGQGEQKKGMKQKKDECEETDEKKNRGAIGKQPIRSKRHEKQHIRNNTQTTNHNKNNEPQ